MPELPEVETLRRGLAAHITGMRITAIRIGDRKIFDVPGYAIKHDVADHQISRVGRRGKVLILFLRGSGGGAGESGSLLIHPKMTGQLVLTCDGATVFAGGHPTPSMLQPMPNATTRAVFRLGPACCLYYNDTRRFGWIRPAGPDPCRTDPFLARLGPEPLDADFTPGTLRQALARHPRAPVKAVLLDQTAVAGIGNIYADEVLHRARIHPSRPAGGLSQAETLRLHGSDPGDPPRGGQQRRHQFRRLRERGPRPPRLPRQGARVPAAGLALRRVRHAHRPHHGRGPRDELLPALPAPR